MPTFSRQILGAELNYFLQQKTKKVKEVNSWFNGYGHLIVDFMKVHNSD